MFSYFASNNILTQPLWRDEAFSVLLSQKSLLSILEITSKDFSPPLYYWLLSGWLQVFGDGEIVVRLLSVFFFLGTVVFVYFLARCLLRRGAAVTAALFAALNPFLFYYAFEARMYTLLAFFATGSFYFLVTKRWLLFVVLSLCGLYTHNFMVFALLGEVAAVLVLDDWGEGKSTRRLSASLAFLLLGHLPWLVVLARQIGTVASSFWVQDPSWEGLFRFFGELMFNSAISGRFVTLGGGVLFFVFAGVVLWRYTRRYLERDSTVLALLSFVLVPVLTVFIFSKILVPLFLPRYLIFVVVPFVLLWALFVDSLPQRAVFVCLLLVAFSCLDYKIWRSPQKKDLRFPMQKISRRWQGEPLVCETILDFFQVKYYAQRFLRGRGEVKLLREGYVAYAGGALVEGEDLLERKPEQPHFLFTVENGVKWCTQDGCSDP